MSVEIGSAVPEFSAPSTGGEFHLKQARGRHLVVYFYPKDNTSGCTVEGQEFAAACPQFARASTDIVGVSRDSLKSHLGFKQKLELPFELLSDPDEHLCKLFGVIKNKTMYGRAVRGIERSTFLLDARGMLRRQWRGVKVAGHVEQVLAAARELG
jgi:thioredoxin-dependent peroxiredoxin